MISVSGFTISRSDFPQGFIFGTAFSAYQEDVDLMKDLGMDAYRFSISWSIIFPNGTGEPNGEGLNYYNNPIDVLLDRGIKPYITLYHWDLLKMLEDKYQGWLSQQIVYVNNHDFTPTFALHYSWSTEDRAKRALANVSALLRPGGIFIGTMPDVNVIVKKLRDAEGLEFGNSVYWIQFDEDYSEKRFRSSSPFGIKYKFHLEDAVDCPEWIVPFHVFKPLAEEYDLELVFVKNSHEFVHEYLKKPEYVELMRRLGALGDGNQDQSNLSRDEWEVAYLYLSFVLRKRGQPDRTQGTRGRDNGKIQLSKEDILFINSES